MKKVRFTEEQMVTILREADKNQVAEVAKKHKISEQTIYVWRRRFGKLEPADVKRLRELETSNARVQFPWCADSTGQHEGLVPSAGTRRYRGLPLA